MILPVPLLILNTISVPLKADLPQTAKKASLRLRYFFLLLKTVVMSLGE